MSLSEKTRSIRFETSIDKDVLTYLLDHLASDLSPVPFPVLLEMLLAAMPEYMEPVSFVVLDVLPPLRAIGWPALAKNHKSHDKGEVTLAETNEAEHMDILAQEPLPVGQSLAPLQRVKQSTLNFFKNLTTALADRNFRLYFSGQLLSMLGDTLYIIVLPWIVISKGGNPQSLGLVLGAYSAPRVITILLADLLSDRMRPRWIMLSSDLVRAILVGLLAVQVFGTHFSFALFTLNVACLGIFTGLFIPTSYSILPDIITKDKLQAASFINATLFQLATLLGYSIAGITVARLQLGIVLTIDAASFLASVAAFVLIRYGNSAKKGKVVQSATIPEQPAEEKVSIWHFMRTSRLLQIALLIDTITFLTAGGMMGVALPSFARLRLDSGAGGYGLLLLMFGVGEVVGCLAAGGLGKLHHRPIILLLLQIIQGGMFALFPLSGMIVGINGAAVVMLLAGTLNGLMNVLYFTLVQQYFPKYLLGRIWGAIMFVSYGLYPLSVVVGGFVTTGFGPSFMFLASGATLTIGALVGLSFREIRELI